MKNQLSKINLFKSAKYNVLALFMASLLTISCSEEKKSETADNTTSTTSTTQEETKYETVSNEVLEDYLELKNALVETDEAAASSASQKLVTALENYDLDSQSSKLTASIVSATDHAKTIVEGDIEKQREAFLMLSNNMMEIINMTGTNTKLYQQHCPMYGENGGSWLSTEEEIRNPYFGSKMMNCGEVQKEIN